MQRLCNINKPFHELPIVRALVHETLHVMLIPRNRPLLYSLCYVGIGFHPLHEYDVFQVLDFVLECAAFFGFNFNFIACSFAFQVLQVLFKAFSTISKQQQQHHHNTRDYIELPKTISCRGYRLFCVLWVYLYLLFNFSV